MPRKKSSTKNHGDIKIEKVLVENFVSLQKVMTNLSVKFDNLASQISKLLELFEISAKSLAKKDFNAEKTQEDQKEIEKKIDALLEQNKIIAKGVTLLHEPILHESFIPEQIPKERVFPPLARPPQQRAPPMIQKPQMREPPITPPKPQGIDKNKYQKSAHVKESSDFITE